MCEVEGAPLDLPSLVEWVFPDLATNCANPAWLAERAILAPLNATVDAVNEAVAASFPGTAWECKSADAPSDPSDLSAPVELLNTFNVPGLPPHELKLKKNMPVMLLRNLDPRAGLCNGTRLLVQRVIEGRLLEAKIATGKHRGDIVYIPRIMLYPEEGAFPWEWSRRQFPVRIAFAMTINKSQAQTLSRVGVYLADACFGHGQLYVAASRVGRASHLRFAIERDETGAYRTANVVYREALSDVAAADARAAPVEYDDAREETGDGTAPLAVATTSAGGGASGMHLDVCTRCTGCSMVDPHTLLCAPCEGDVDAMEPDAELTREAVDAALARLFSDGARDECTLDELLEELSDMASSIEVTVEFGLDALEPIIECLQAEQVITYREGAICRL